jgi:hypothetical protein
LWWISKAQKNKLFAHSARHRTGLAAVSQVFFIQIGFQYFLHPFCAMLSAKEEEYTMQMYNIELCESSAGKSELPVRLTINVMAEDDRQAIECAKERLISVGLKNNANMVRVRENGGSIIWEGR